MSLMAKTANELVKITNIEGRGRGLVSTQPIKPGEILLKDSPILLYSAIPLKNGDRSTYCSSCFQTLTNLSTITACPNCSYHALFCSPNCQTLALSSSHSSWVCQALNSIRYSSFSLPLESQIQLHFLIAAYNLAAVSPSNFHLLLSLQGDSPSTPDPLTLAIHSHLSSLSPPRSTFGFSPDLTAALLAKDKQNAFGLMEPYQITETSESSDRSVRAYAIYSTASFFNHDCLPNACRFDYVDTVIGSGNTDIIVRAIHEIPEGREICLSYFPVNWSYADRQKRLLEEYGFLCNCDRCKVEMNWKDDDDMDGDEEDEEMMAGSQEENDFPHAYFFLSYVCDEENCGGTLAPLPSKEQEVPVVGFGSVMECNVCGRLKSREEMDADGSDGSMADE